MALTSASVSEPFLYLSYEHSFLISEQFGGGKFFLQQNTIYRHERLVCPFALCAYPFGDVFLARNALAQYQDTQVRGRDLPYLVVYLFERSACTFKNGYYY